MATGDFPQWGSGMYEVHPGMVQHVLPAGYPYHPLSGGVTTTTSGYLRVVDPKPTHCLARPYKQPMKRPHVGDIQ